MGTCPRIEEQTLSLHTLCNAQQWQKQTNNGTYRSTNQQGSKHMLTLCQWHAGPAGSFMQPAQKNHTKNTKKKRCALHKAPAWMLTWGRGTEHNSSYQCIVCKTCNHLQCVRLLWYALGRCHGIGSSEADGSCLLGSALSCRLRSDGGTCCHRPIGTSHLAHLRRHLPHRAHRSPVPCCVDRGTLDTNAGFFLFGPAPQ